MTPAAVHPSIFASIGIIALVLWRLYARIRRTIGRQAFKRRRVIVTLVVFPTVIGLLLLTSIANPINAIPLCAGAAMGALLGVYGLRLTRFEATEAGHFYTPNAHLGIALSLLFVGRLAYRFLHLQMINDAPLGPPMDFTRSPLTLLIFATLAGYYIAYAIGLLRWSQRTPIPSPGRIPEIETTGSETYSAKPEHIGDDDAHRHTAAVARTGQEQESRST